MQAYTIWVTPTNAPHMPMLLDRCDEGKPLWFLSEKAALHWVREELFGEADRLPFSIEIKKMEVADLPKQNQAFIK